MRDRLPYWIGGTLIALLGAALVRLLAPALGGWGASASAIAGYLLVIVGITLLARAARPQDAEALADPEAND